LKRTIRLAAAHTEGPDLAEVVTWGRCARCGGAVRLLGGTWHHPGKTDHMVRVHPAYRLEPAQTDVAELVLAMPEPERLRHEVERRHAGEQEVAGGRLVGGCGAHDGRRPSRLTPPA
jgi:hypothetical protein